jgi:hypothetical protein
MNDIVAMQEYAAQHLVELTEEQAAEVARFERAYAAIGYPGFAYHLFRVIQMDKSLADLKLVIDSPLGEEDIRGKGDEDRL